MNFIPNRIGLLDPMAVNSTFSIQKSLESTMNSFAMLKLILLTTICVAISTNFVYSRSPLAAPDCYVTCGAALEDKDGDGVPDSYDLDDDNDIYPSDEIDECDLLLVGVADICILLMTEPDHPLATADCDNGGLSNELECEVGLDPLDPTDDCPDAFACIDMNISLDGNCTADITGNMIAQYSNMLHEDYYLPNEAFVVTITDADGNIVLNPVGEAHLGQTLNVTVGLAHCPNVTPCWSTATIEDKLLPSLELPEICIVACNALYLEDGSVEIPDVDTDNCGGAEVIWLGDVPDPDFDCEDPLYDGFSGVYIRSFAVVDAAMNTDGTVYTKEMWVERPDLTDIEVPADITIDGCDTTLDDFDVLGVPFQCDEAVFELNSDLTVDDPGQPRDVELGDIDGDGDLDAVVAHQDISSKVYLNDGSGGYTLHQTITNNLHSLGVILVDLDGDGDLDAFFANRNPAGGVSPNTVYFYDSNTGQFMFDNSYGNAASFDVDFGDFDNDGDYDIVVANNLGTDNVIWFNDGDGRFPTSVSLPTALTGSRDVLVLDFDNDGNDDIVFGTVASGSPILFHNDGSGTFTQVTTSLPLLMGEIHNIANADLDGDGDMDLVFAVYRGASVVWINESTSTAVAFNQGFSFNSGAGMNGYLNVELSDIDCDSNIDVLFGHEVGTGQPNTIWLSNGDGTYALSSENLGANNNVFDIEIGDLDGDEKEDVFVVNLSNQTLEIFLNESSQERCITFQPGAQTGEFCNVFVSYTDSDPVLTQCSDYTIIRTWRVVEWFCGTEYTAPAIFPQVISVADNSGPELSELPDVTISTVHDCSVDYSLPVITATDACNGIGEYLINTGVNPVYTNNGETVTFTHDGNNVDGTVYTIDYVVTDGCHNSSQESFELTVIDDKGPIAICEFETQVDLSGTGVSTVYAESLDDGSFDGCGYINIEVRRMTDNCDTPENLVFGPSVSFCCADKGTEQMVVLQVTDSAGNSNICMITVIVPDKDDTIFTVPDDQELTSDECAAIDLSLIEAFGPVTVEDECLDCEDLSCITIEESESVFECNTEVYTRTYTLTKPNGDIIVMSHTVTCIGVGYDFADLICPVSVIDITDPTVGGCLGDISPESLGSEPILNAGPLDQLAVNFVDEPSDPVVMDGETFYKKVERTWTILDWCATGGDEIVSTTCVQTINLLESPFDACVTDIVDLDLDAGCQVTISAPFTANPGCVVYTIDGGADNFLQTGTTVSLSLIEGAHTVEWSAINLFGDTETCTTHINVLDPLGVCPLMLTQNRIQGHIHTEMNLDVKDIQVKLMGTSKTVVTDDQGNYDFGYMSSNGSYEVEPYNDVEHRNGVSTLDIIIIQRHLLNLNPLASPYQFIAADANNSGSLSASDIVDIRKLILEVNERFPTNTSWRFVDDQQVFIDPSNPFVEGIDETYQIPQLISNMNANFVGVKIGDVNNSAVMSSTGNDVELRGGPLSIGYSRGSGAIDLTANEAMDLSGLQLELVFDQKVNSLTSVLPGFGEDNYVISGNRVKLSYAAKSILRVTKGQSLFEAFTESRSVVIGEGNLQSEVYTGDTDLIVHSVQLENKNKGLYSPKMANQPNPWTQSTDIVIVTPIAQNVEIEFTNELGQVIYTYSDYAHVGINRFTLSKESLNTSGIVYYTALVGTETLKGTMLITE